MGAIGSSTAATITMGAIGAPVLIIGGVAAGIFGVVVISAGVGYGAFKIAKKACKTNQKTTTQLATENDEGYQFDETQEVLEAIEVLDTVEIMKTVDFIQDKEVDESIEAMRFKHEQEDHDAEGEGNIDIYDDEFYYL